MTSFGRYQYLKRYLMWGLYICMYMIFPFPVASLYFIYFTAMLGLLSELSVLKFSERICGVIQEPPVCHHKHSGICVNSVNF